MKELLKENSSVSSIRLALLVVVFIFAIMGIGILAVMIIQACTEQTINWTGMAALVGACTGPLLPAFGFKAFQKGKEKP